MKFTFVDTNSATRRFQSSQYCTLYQRGQCLLFSVVFTLSSHSHSGSVQLVPVISQLLTNTLSPGCGLAWSYDGRCLVGPKKKTIVGLLVLNPLCSTYIPSKISQEPACSTLLQRPHQSVSLLIYFSWKRVFLHKLQMCKMSELPTSLKISFLFFVFFWSTWMLCFGIGMCAFPLNHRL